MTKEQNTRSKNEQHEEDCRYEPIDPEQERLDNFLQHCMEQYWQQYDNNYVLRTDDFTTVDEVNMDSAIIF